MFVTVVFIIVKIGNKPNTHQVINAEINVLYPYNGILLCHRKNEILIHATMWKNLENIMLSQ